MEKGVRLSLTDSVFLVVVKLQTVVPDREIGFQMLMSASRKMRCSSSYLFLTLPTHPKKGYHDENGINPFHPEMIYLKYS